MPTNIDDLSIRITSDADQAVNAIDRLSNSLLNLKSSAKLTSAINNISKLSNALNGISNSKGLSSLNALSGTIQNLSNNVSKSLTSSINAINRLPKSINALDDTKIEQLGSAFNKLNEMIKPLAKTIAPIQSGLQSLSAIATRGVSGLNSISVAATKTYKSFSIFGNLKGLIGLIPWKIMIDSIGKAINSTNSYIENLNLFRVAMGENYEEAYEYAMLLQDKMGIDAGEFMRNQGIIQSMANGFGIAKDQAYQFSKGMTEVAYDLSSFFNIDIETAMQKVESGIAGEIEPLRRLGFALSEASLQQVAYEHGINKSIRSMTEAEKAQIRYTAIVEQASQMGAIGDFAKTLESPANALRILQQQIVQLARAIGSVFIPILTKVLPYIQAFVSIVTDAIRALASLVGFELPDWGGSSWSAAESGSAAVADNMGAAAANAKKMGDNIQGFDELNTMDKDTGSGSGGGVSGGGGGLNMDLASVWDEAVIAGIETQVDAIKQKIYGIPQTIMEVLQSIPNEVFTVLGAVASGIGTYFAVNKLFPNLNMGGFIDNLKYAFMGLGEIGDIIATPFKNLGTKIIGVISPAFSSITGFFSKGFSTIAGKIGTMMSPITSAVSGAMGTVGTAISSAFTKFTQLPVVSQAIGGLQSAFGSLGTMLGNVTSHLGVVGNGLSKVLGIIGSSPVLIAAVIAAIVGALIQLWNTNEDFRNNVIEAWNNICEVAQTLWDTTLKPIIDLVIEWVMKIWENAIKPLWDKWVDFVGVVSNIMLDLWNNIAPVINEILEYLGPIITDVLDVLLNTFGVVFQGISTAIQVGLDMASGFLEGFFSSVDDIIGGIKKIFEGIINFVTGVFTGDWKKAWEGVRGVFKGIWDALTGIVKAPVNGIIGIINKAIDGINSISIDVPDWVPIFGGDHWGFNIPKIPYLAQGGFIEANSPQLAVIGDNRRYGEIVAPENKLYDITTRALKASDYTRNENIAESIKQALIEALEEADINQDIYLDGVKVTKQIAKNVRQLERTTGRNVIFG